ncbi:MAG: hypothetical protein HXY25_09315 [Alphaproteobacteria bacterium]|nr:hypothetical protein [Alphaproteobacteria bacterium]
MRGNNTGMFVLAVAGVVLLLVAGAVVYLGTISVDPEPAEVVIPDETFPR